MPLPPKKTPYVFKDRVDRAVDEFAELKKPTRRDLNRVKVFAQVQNELIRYRAAAKNMTPEQLEDEEHDSQKMGEYLIVAGDPCPHSLCDAHAIVSGGHTRAAELRAVLAWFQMRIDDPANGCWLPRNTDAKQYMPQHLRSAVPHSRIHRKGYYRWLDQHINLELISDESGLEQALKMVKLRLHKSTFPDWVMLPADKIK